jgi:cell division protein FtsW
MNKDTENTAGSPKKGFWNFIDNIEGDKVVWIIVFMLLMISALAIFSSTSALTGENKDRVDMLRTHAFFIAGGLTVIWMLYKIKSIRFFKRIAQTGFFFSFILLLLLDSGIDLGFLKPANINEATRLLLLFDKFQVHVFEFVKVAMVMYLAWALDAYHTDEEQMKKGEKPTTLKWANRLAEKYEKLAFLKEPLWKRISYLYAPVVIATGMCIMGSNSSMIFIGGVSLIILWIGRMRIRELLIIIALGVIGIFCLIGVHYISGGKYLESMRIETLISRVTNKMTIETLIETEEDPEHGKRSPKWYYVRGKIKQPYTAIIAIQQGGLIGKGSGNSTQKYIVTHIYSDYMFSFIVEEYGLLGGVLIIILFVSLLARGAMIARLCQNDFAKYAVGGMSFMITAQAFMHIMVNLDIGFRTGQTLPLISDGRFAFIMFCIAFGIILSISKIAKRQIQEEENEAKPLYESVPDDQEIKE